jgi:hypothetical protein
MAVGVAIGFHHPGGAKRVNPTTSRFSAHGTRGAPRGVMKFAYVSVCVVGLVAACTSGPEVSVEMQGFPALDGKVARWVITDTIRDEEVAAYDVSISGGGFDLALDGLEAGRTYRLDGFVDQNGDERCEAGIDMAFTFEVDANALDEAGVTFHIEPTTNLAMWAGCRSFGAGDYTLRFDDLPADRWLEVRLVESASGDVVFTAETVTGSGDGEVVLPGVILADTFYEVVIWVDSDSDMTCDGSDLVWRQTTGAVGIPGSGLGTEVAGGDTRDGCSAR